MLEVSRKDIKHIALFVPSLTGGGAERVMITLAKEFSRRGFKVDILVITTSGPYLKEVPDTVNLINLNRSRVLFSVFKLARYMRKERPDVLMSTMNHVNVVAIISGLISFSPVKVIVREAITATTEFKASDKLADKVILRLLKLLYPRASNIICPSQGIAKDLEIKLSIPKDKLKVIYNPLDIKHISLLAAENALHPWVEAGENIILGVGRLAKQKGFDTLVTAFSVVRECSDVPVKLIILGEGEDRDILQDHIDKLGLQDCVDLPGFVDNPYAFIRYAKCYVLSSLWEGLPNVLIQALALGTPAVATDCPSGPVEILESGKWGELVSMSQPEEMASAILRVLSKAENNNSLTKKYCEEKFGLERIANEYLHVLNS